MSSCKECSKLFLPKRNTKGFFCSRSCSSTYNNRKYPKRSPGPNTRKPAKPKIKKWLDGEWDGTVKSGLSHIVRDFLLKEANYQCEQCGWAGVNPKSKRSTLTVDHTDGNSKNNLRSNLKVLCPNCHSLTPTYGALNKGHGRKSRYVVEV